MVIAYNTNLVRPTEAPKGYADLLNPKWKNDLSIDTEPEQAVFVWLLDWGEEKTVEYMKALMRNGAVPRRGHTLQVQLLCSGETKIAVEVYPARARSSAVGLWLFPRRRILDLPSFSLPAPFSQSP